MSMNEKVIVGETFDDLSDQEMAMLTGNCLFLRAYVFGSDDYRLLPITADSDLQQVTNAYPATVCGYSDFAG